MNNNAHIMYTTDAPSYEDAMNASGRAPPTTHQVTPYLGLRARLSQVWFNRWTLLLFLVLVRLMLATQSLDGDLSSARREALSACTGVESMGSAMASMPHYMSKGVNEVAAMGIETAVKALEKTLLLLITGVQEIVVFVINMITATYVCLITLAVQGSLGAVLNATEKIADFVNNTMSRIFDDVGKDVKSVQDGINKVSKALEKVPNFFGSNINLPDAKFPSLDELKKVQIPTSFDDDLKKMKDKIPTFDEVQKASHDAIRIPFQLISKKVNESMGVYKFDRSVFPIPEKEKLTFCSGNPKINNFFDGLVSTVDKVKKILIGIIVCLAILAVIPMGYREWWNWRTTQSRAFMLHTAPTYDPIDVIQIASRPYSSSVGLKLASRFKSSRRQILVRWAVAYATSTPALFVLSLGIAGLFGVLAQYIVLKQVESAAPALAAEVGAFADIVVKQLTTASTLWAVKTNSAINSTNADINRELFGWVVNGTDSLNDTLTVFVDKMYEGVDLFFGKTPLATPIKDVLNCLIGIKVKGIQKGLTWAHENAHINLPLLPNDTFSLGAADSITPEANGAASFLSDTSSHASDMITDVVFKLTDKWEKMLTQEAIISACIVAIWLIVLIIAIVRTVALFYTSDKHRGEVGGRRALPPSMTTATQQQVQTASLRDAATNGGRVPASPVFPAFGGSPTGSESLPSSSPAGRDAYHANSSNEKVDPNARWLQVGGAITLEENSQGEFRRSVYPSVHPGKH
ncbi:hypothetical protein L873DRAFT_1827376 [Choiromyces venosus 120613-1]|uniref:Plasma membrane fusion protein PRM1 n=1 Tax=Choiromyces venosus 120613-1 TaxID=1336337 RepID=A0A3N4JVG2_9PEZI|nr:hypothetical protein L873DRAFT_1827376 [Choiromyces venosus 120613-1]